MKKRKINGFTLIELLAVIVIIGLVAAIGGYFAINAIENSKKKSYEISKQSVMKSAITYASEFLEEEDWVPVEGAPSNEKSCIDVQWLINKGYSKKNDFLDVPTVGNDREKYRLYSDSVVVINRNKNTKAITSSDLFDKDAAAAKDCINTLTAELIEVKTTTKSITVSADCKIKDIVPSDIKYSFTFNGKETTTSTNNLYKYDNLEDNKSFSISVTCESKYGNKTVSNTFSTDELKKPVIDVKEKSINVDYIHSNDEEITSTILIDKPNSVKIYNGKIAIDNNKEIKAIPLRTTLDNGKTYIVNSKNIMLYNIISDNPKATLIAINSDGHNERKIEQEIKIVYTEYNIEPAIFVASDDIVSDDWHTKNFELSIIGGEEEEVEYYYGTSKNSVDKLYREPIPITEETTGTKLYARACISTVCTKPTEYIVKLDKTAPQVNVKIKDSTNGKNILECSSDKEGKCEKADWINKNVSLSFSSNDINGSGINEEAEFNYNRSDQLTYGNLWHTRTETLSNGNISINITGNGSRYVTLKVCDLAGNCTTKEVYFKTDTVAPSLEVKMGYIGGSGISLIKAGDLYQNNKWLNKHVKIYFDSVDTLSGVNQEATFSYNSAGNVDLVTDNMTIKSVDLTNGGYSKDIDSDGNREVNLKVCDKAGNCTTKKVRFKVDTTPPSIDVTMNGKTNLLLNCSGTLCQNDKWLPELVKLNFTSSDNLGLADNAKFIYNSAFSSQDDFDIIKSSSEKASTGSFTRAINSPGNRHVALKVCDLAGNCTTREVKFKIDTDKPLITYDNKGSVTAGNSGYRNFSCKSLSGTSFFEGVDADGNKSNSNGKDTLSFWKSGGNAKTKDVTLTCKSNSGLISKYVLKTNCSTSTSRYDYLCYNHKTEAYVSGFSTVNPCSKTDIVYCGGASTKINTNCYSSDDRYLAGDGKYYSTLHYYEWGCCSDYSSSTVCREIFEAK